MGKVFKIVKNIFTGGSISKKKRKDKPPVVDKQAQGLTQKRGILSSGYGLGGGGNIMTSPSGVEDKARTGKTLLGGG